MLVQSRGAGGTGIMGIFRNVFVLRWFLNSIRKFYFVFLQHWEVFKNVTEVFILVPALLGLKGNLEMTLASRLSTAVSSFLPQSVCVYHLYCFLCEELASGKTFSPLSVWWVLALGAVTDPICGVSSGLSDLRTRDLCLSREVTYLSPLMA